MSHRRDNRNSLFDYNPWENQSHGNSGNYGLLGNQGVGADALNLANNIINNLLRNQNPPSLLDLSNSMRGGGGFYGDYGPYEMDNRGNNRNRRGHNYVRNDIPKAKNQGGGQKPNNKTASKRNRKDSNSDENIEKSPKDSTRESIYAGVPNKMFYCHLCKKHMWDAMSFENHIKGRAHMMMRDGIEESYRLKANMLRQEAKLEEQLKLIEFDRLKRMGKAKGTPQRDYCTMCDLDFHGHLSAHRKTESHLILKNFLHPKCTLCDEEFANRIDMDTHLLKPEHLKNAAKRDDNIIEKWKQSVQILTEEDELKDIKYPNKKSDNDKKKKTSKEIIKKTDDSKAGDSKSVTGDENEDSEEIADKDKEANGEHHKSDGDDAPVADAVDCITDYKQGDEIPIDIESRLPKYNHERSVGMSLIHKLDCFECILCGKFFDTEKTCEIHSRTVNHHQQFIKFINDKSTDTKITQKRAAAALEESEKKKRKLEKVAEKSNENEGECKGENEEEENAEEEDDVDNENDNEDEEEEEEEYDENEENGEDVEGKDDEEKQVVENSDNNNETDAEENESANTSDHSPAKAVDEKIKKEATNPEDNKRDDSSESQTKNEPVSPEKTQENKTTTQKRTSTVQRNIRSRTRNN